MTKSAAESDGTYLLIYQFEFTGNVTLTATNTSGNPSDDCIQGVFLDYHPERGRDQSHRCGGFWVAL